MYLHLHVTPFLAATPHVCSAVDAAPPIDFADAMKKARAAVEGKVAGIVGGTVHTDSNSGAGAAVETKSLVAAINRDARLTFSYLLMQLHARGGQTFWVSATGTFSITSSDNNIFIYPLKKVWHFLTFASPPQL